jgi:hypothetical protein
VQATPLEEIAPPEEIVLPDDVLPSEVVPSAAAAPAAAPGGDGPSAGAAAPSGDAQRDTPADAGTEPPLPPGGATPPEDAP